MMKTPSIKKINKIIKRYKIIFILSFLIVFAGSFYGYKNYKKNELRSEDVIVMISKIMVLPNDEVPTIATVSSLEPLKDSLFFRNAKIGDKVVIYSNTAKAILFRVEENRIIEVGPLNIGDLK